MPSISVRSLYQDNQHKLQLAWAAGAAGCAACAATGRTKAQATSKVLNRFFIVKVLLSVLKNGCHYATLYGGGKWNFSIITIKYNDETMSFKIYLL